MACSTWRLKPRHLWMMLADNTVKEFRGLETSKSIYSRYSYRASALSPDTRDASKWSCKKTSRTSHSSSRGPLTRAMRDSMDMASFLKTLRLSWRKTMISLNSSKSTSQRSNQLRARRPTLKMASSLSRVMLPRTPQSSRKSKTAKAESKTSSPACTPTSTSKRKMTSERIKQGLPPFTISRTTKSCDSKKMRIDEKRK